MSLSQLNQIDFVLVSKPLKDGFQDAGIERRGLFGVRGITPFPSNADLVHVRDHLTTNEHSWALMGSRMPGR